MSYNKEYVILIPYGHPFTKLYAEYIHSLSHLAVQATVPTIQLAGLRLHKMIKLIVYKCAPWRKKRKELMQQKMSPLPLDRLMPAPPWHNIALDICGPYTIRREVNKRVKGKCYLVLFNCLVTRCVHVDVSSNLSRDELLKTLRRFVSQRGKPSIIYANNGSQIRAASKEMKAVIKYLASTTLVSYGAEEGTSWKFTSPDATW